MKKLKPTTVILVTLFSCILLSIPAPETVGSNDPSITEVTPIELGTITSNYYHMSDNSFDRLYSSDGKLKLSYNTEALLKVNLSSADPGVDLNDLEISLLPVEDNNWKSFGDGTEIQLKTFTNTDQTWDFVEYQLRYLPDGNDRPGNYSFSLNFELIQVGLVIRIIGGKPGPGKKVNLKVSDNSGPVGNASVRVNDEVVGTTNPGGILNNLTFPEDEEKVTIAATHDSREATRVFNFEEDDEEDDEGEEEED